MYSDVGFREVNKSLVTLTITEHIQTTSKLTGLHSSVGMQFSN
jgi:hypothetical protein